MLNEKTYLYGFNNVKTTFSMPPREQTPPDFKKEILSGKRPVLGDILMVPGDEEDVKVIKWVEITTHRGKCILNGTNPLSWEWIAKVHYGIFGYPVRIEIYPHIPKDAAKVVLRLLKKEFF